MKHMLLTLGASTLLLVGTGAQVASPSGGEIVTVDATGGITLGEFLGIAQQELGIGYFVGIGSKDQSLELELSGKVQVRRDEFLGLFEKVLRHHGLVHLEEQVGSATMHHVQPIHDGRVNLREATMRGDVPGLRKASW